MGFSTRFKDEILAIEYDTREKNIAFLSAVLYNGGSFHIDRNGYNIELESDNHSLIMAVIRAAKKVFDIDFDVNIKSVNGIKTYTVKVPRDYTKEIADITGFVVYDDGRPVAFGDGVKIALGDEEIAPYLAGVVCALATVTVPQRIGEATYKGGYHFEMHFISRKNAEDVLELLKRIGISAKFAERGETYGIYIKDSTVIGDLIGYLGGREAMFEIADIIVARSFRNKANRARNCTMANLDKAIEAGQKQLMAIEKIERIKGAEFLPDKLKEIALIRKENPDYTLEEIAESLATPISKSGINHRLRKIMEIAEELEDK